MSTWLRTAVVFPINRVGAKYKTKFRRGRSWQTIPPKCRGSRAFLLWAFFLVSSQSWKCVQGRAQKNPSFKSQSCIQRSKAEASFLITTRKPNNLVVQVSPPSRGRETLWRETPFAIYSRNGYTAPLDR